MENMLFWTRLSREIALVLNIARIWTKSTAVLTTLLIPDRPRPWTMSSLPIFPEHFFLLLRPRERLRSIVMRMSVCGSICVSVCPRGYFQNHTRDLYQIFVDVAYVRGSVLLRHVYDRPHRLSPERGFLPLLKCIIGRERGMGVHSTGEVC